MDHQIGILLQQTRINSFSGSTTNDQRPSPLAVTLALANSSANGKGLVFAYQLI